MKKVIFITSVILFFVFDYHSYYYGFGFGIFNKKLPKEYGILFSGSDLGNQGIIIEDKVMMGTYLVKPQSSIILKPSKKEIQVNKIVGYYFTKKEFIAVIEDSFNQKINVEIRLNPVNQKWKYEFEFYEINQINKKFKFINLNHSIQYFKIVKLLRNILLLFIIGLFFYRLILWLR